MAIEGLRKINSLGGIGHLAIEKNFQSMDRDANQGSNPYQKNPLILTAEQEDEILKQLQQLPLIVQAGLYAELLRSSGQLTVIRLNRSSGEVVKTISLDEAIHNIRNSANEGSRGLLLRRSA